MTDVRLVTRTGPAPAPALAAPFDRLGQLALRVLDLPVALVVLLDDRSLFPSARPGFPELDAEQLWSGRELALQLARAGTVAISDVDADGRTSANSWLLRMGLRSVAAAPLTGPYGELLGALCVADTAVRLWSEDHLGLLAALAETAASKATLRGAVRRSDETAALLQHSMLTDLPHVADLELVARYLPAQDTAQVGGDWYDAFVLPDGVTAVVVGDVAGHDMPAAAKMGQLRNLLRGIAWHSNAAPHAVLSSLDTTSYGLGVAELATVIYARIEPVGDGWQVRWANAGHPPPLLVLADSSARYLDRPSGLLLAFGDAEHTDGVAALPAGSTLLLYTDGLIESRRMDIDHGLERLRHAASRGAHLPVDQLCDLVLRDLTGVGNEDDVTLLAIRMPVATAQA